MIQRVLKYQRDFDYYLTEKEHVRKTVRYQTTHVLFVVAWQLEEDEKKDEQTIR